MGTEYIQEPKVSETTCECTFHLCQQRELCVGDER